MCRRNDGAVRHTPPHTMVVTDLDGTLLDSSHRLSTADRDTLETLGAMGIKRVIATGRSLHSALTVLPLDTPIDYLVFSSGAGILRWTTQTLLRAHGMERQQALEVCRFLIAAELDFMVHEAVPGNHFMTYYSTGRLNPDFDQRCERYRQFATAWETEPRLRNGASQLLAVEPPGVKSQLQPITTAFPNLNVIRTTSPLDGRSTWIEIFPDTVSKAQASAWLAERYGVERAGIVAVGNDYNDTDLLDWAGVAFVVENGVEALRARYAVVPSNDDNGFSAAVRAGLGERLPAGNRADGEDTR